MLVASSGLHAHALNYLSHSWLATHHKLVWLKLFQLFKYFSWFVHIEHDHLVFLIHTLLASSLLFESFNDRWIIMPVSMSDTVQLSILLWDGLIFSLSYEQYFLSHLEHFFLQILMSLNLLTCLDLLIRFCNGWIVVIIPLLVHYFGTIDPVLANELVYLTVRVLQMFHWASQRVTMCSHFSQLILPVASATHTYTSTKGTKLCTLHFKQRRVIKVPDTLLTVHSLTLCKVVVINYHLLGLAWTPI